MPIGEACQDLESCHLQFYCFLHFYIQQFVRPRPHLRRLGFSSAIWIAAPIQAAKAQADSQALTSPFTETSLAQARAAPRSPGTVKTVCALSGPQVLTADGGVLTSGTRRLLCNWARAAPLEPAIL